MGGPREAVQHALIRKNYGCTHMIVGRDHAGCKDKAGNDFYGPFDAHDLLLPLSKELGIDIVPFQAMVYCTEEDRYMPAEEAEKKGYKPMNISGTKFRQMLIDGDEIPEVYEDKFRDDSGSAGRLLFVSGSDALLVAETSWLTF